MLLSLSLAGCFASGDAAVTGAVSGGAAAPAALVRQPTLLVATTRRPAENPEERPWFTAERGRGLAFAEARLSPPDRSLMGRVASVVAGDWAVASVGPVREAGAAQAFAEAAMGRDVLLLVHGYRESFETAALAAARLSDGIGFTGATGVFSWPSGGGTFDYVHDRDSAMWSRDALEELLTALSRSSSGGRVHVMAHSMGTLLALETLRTLRASGGEAAMARIGAVVLASPDVDVDLFVRSVERLGPDAKKITVITSTKDRALGLSARIAGGVRAGAADRDRLAKLEALGVRIADASDYGAGFVNHDLFLSNDDVREVVRRAIERAG
ncbi:MAG TPA: alpha/beta fold hydrolase [Beijerinckiaceae bacterium]